MMRKARRLHTVEKRVRGSPDADSEQDKTSYARSTAAATGWKATTTSALEHALDLLPGLPLILRHGVKLVGYWNGCSG